MKASGFLKVGILLWAILAGVGFLVIQCRGALPTVLYSTGFEASEGFSTNANLVNQNGWVGFGSGGNGVVEGFFAGGGQQAYLGFSPPTGNGDELTIWHPTNFTPTNRAQQVVTFFVKMSIEDSSGANTNYDDFRWSVYNVAAERLFSIDFDNSTFRISYALDGTNGFVFTGETFTNSVAYELVVQMRPCFTKPITRLFPERKPREVLR